MNPPGREPVDKSRGRGPASNEISTPMELYIDQIRGFDPALADRVQHAVDRATRMEDFTEAELRAMYVSMKRPQAGMLANSLSDEAAAEVRRRYG